MNGRLSEVLLCAAAALGVGLAAPAGAQVAPAAGGAPQPATLADEDLSEIVVTARRVEERAQDVPISMTVFNQEQLENRNVVNSADLALYTPSLSANTNFGTENSSFAIRGFVQDAGTAPSVGTYFADVVAPRGPTQGTQAGDGAGPGSFFDLQNVQILNGPQGTLFGRNTTGGAVLFVPQKPTSKFEGFGEISYGNFDMIRAQGALNLPFGDAVRFRLAVDHESRDGYLNNISGIGPSDYDNVNYTAVRASLVVDVTSNVENYTIASYSNSSTNGSVQKLIGCNPTGYPAVNFAALANFIGIFSCSQLAAEATRGASFYDVEAAVPNPESIIDQWQVINTTTWSANDAFTVKNIASYAQFTDKQRSPLFGTNWQLSELPTGYQGIFGIHGIPAVFTGVFPIPGGDSADQSTYTEEMRLQGSTADQKLTYQGGVYLEWSDPLALSGNQSSQLAACADPANLSSCSDPIGSLFSLSGTPTHVGAVNYTAGETTYRDQGVYTQSSYSLTDQWKITGGARYTWDSVSNQATRISYSFPVTAPFTAAATASCTDPSTAPSCAESLHEHSSKPTWLIDLDYKPTEDMLAYAKYARGYRAGGVFSNGPIDHRSFDPEKVDNFELGLKTAFHGAVHGTFNVDAFYNDFSNQQLQFGFDARINPLTGLPAPVSPTTAIVNAGKSRIYGTEVETSITPFPSMPSLQGLSFNASYTYLNATIREIAPVSTTDPNYQVQVSAITPGSPLVLSPKNKYTATGNYTLPLNQDVGHITFGVTFTHTDHQLTSYAYQSPAIVALFGKDFGILPSTDLINLNLSWDSIAGTPLDLALFATNVAQKHYYQFVPGLASSGSEYAVLGEPRFYGARLRYRFGNN
jgi:iron complex outermembrane receptor protein